MKKKGTIPRRQSRIRAVQLLYSMEFNKPDSLINYLKRYQEEIASTLQKDTYALKIVEGVVSSIDEVDILIKNSVVSIFDISAIDVNIIRVAIYEGFIAREVKPAIVMDEAVEVAKILSTISGKKLINGVLDNIFKDVE